MDQCWITKKSMWKMLHAFQWLSLVRLNRLIAFIAFIQLFGIILMSYSIYQKLEEVVSSGIQSKFPSGTLAALNRSDLPQLSFNGRWLSTPALPRRMNIREEKDYVSLLQTLHQLLTEAGVEYIMCDGTLLGSFMSHGFLPWDDDADVMVNIKHLDEVNEIFQDVELQKEYSAIGYNDDIDDNDYYYQPDYIPSNEATDSLFDHDRYKLPIEPLLPSNEDIHQFNVPGYRDFHKFKFFRKKTNPAGEAAWGWPYVDIKYYINNGTHITNIDFQTELFHVPVALFYPIVMRPFSTLWLPAPHNTRAHLRAKYKKFACNSSPWSHKLERRRPVRKVNCMKLTDFYPFVWRHRFVGGTLETLKLGHHVLHTIALKDKYQQRYGPFTL